MATRSHASAFGASTRRNPVKLCRGGDDERARCRQEVANDLDAFIGHRPIARVEVDRDQHGHSVAVRTVAGIDLAEWLAEPRDAGRSCSPCAVRERGRRAFFIQRLFAGYPQVAEVGILNTDKALLRTNSQRGSSIGFPESH